MNQGAKAVLTATLLLLAATLRADGAVREVPEAAPVPDPVREISHQVELHFTADRVAEFQVTRTLRSDSGGAQEATLVLRLPEHGAVTGFSVGVDGQMYQGHIRRADAALARYQELRGPGDGPPRMAGLLSWQQLGLVAVSVFPVFPGERVVVQYQVTAALDYAGGRLHASYPGPHGGEVRPTLHVSAAWSGAQVSQDAPPLPMLDPDQHPLDVWVTPPPIDVVAARFAEVGLASDRRLVRVELEAAPHLGELPVRARVVFVLDVSWSEADVGIAAQLQLVRGYLANLPDASFEIVVFARAARRVFADFVPAGQVDARLEQAMRAGAFAPANGSDASAGLALAAAALAGTGSKRPARVVLMSDRWYSRTYTAQAALRALARLPRAAIVHVVERKPGAGDLAEERDDGDDFDPVVGAFGGQILRITGESNDRAALAAVTLGLVRPIRIDDFEIDAGDTLAGLVLPEGEGERYFTIARDELESLGWSGRIWGRRFARRVRPDAGLLARVPALVFGDELFAELRPNEAVQLGLAAGAVGPETSFLAEPADAEPSTVGFEELTGMSGSGSSSCSIGCSSRCRFPAPRVAGPPPDWSAKLAAWVTPAAEVCAHAHGVSLSGVGFAIEATGDEIVAVRVTGVSDPALRRCVEDAVWAVRLDGDFVGQRDYEAEMSVSATAPAR